MTRSLKSAKAWLNLLQSVEKTETRERLVALATGIKPRVSDSEKKFFCLLDTLPLNKPDSQDPLGLSCPSGN